MPLLGPGDHARAGLAEDAIALTNPMVGEESLLRTSLRPGLLQVARPTTSRTATSGVGLFELGHVFRRPAAGEPLPDERELLTAVRAGADAPRRPRWWRELAMALAVGRCRGARGEPTGLHPARCAVLVEPRRRRARRSSARSTRPSSRRTASPSGSAILEVDLLALLGAAARQPAVPAGEPLPVERPRPRLRPARRGAGGHGRRRAVERRAASCWLGSSCSTSTGVPAWPRAHAAWPTGCGSRPRTARSPTADVAGGAPACIDGGGRRRGRRCGPESVPEAVAVGEEHAGRSWAARSGS